MPSNHLEELVAEWYQWCGFFVRRNVPVGKRPAGGYECELDVVAFHPKERRLVQVEPSLDADSWETREKRYRKKFDAGRKYIPMLFEGLSLPSEIEQIAIFVYGAKRDSLAGGKVWLVKELMCEILAVVRKRPLVSAAIPEQYPLLRTLQFAYTCWPIGEVAPSVGGSTS